MPGSDRRAPRRGPARCRCRRPRRCGGRRSAGRRPRERSGRDARGGPADPACDRGSRPRCRAHRPRRRRARGSRGRRSRRSGARSAPSSWSRWRWSGCRSSSPIVANAGLHRAGVHLEALRAGHRSGDAREPAAGGRADLDLAEAAPEVRRRQRRREPRRAGCRQDVVRAGDVVAECGARPPGRRTRSRRA